MAWPFTPLTSYVGGGVPAIKAVDLNAFQASHNYLHSTLYSSYFYLADDFTGTAIDTSRWDPGAVDIAVADDSANNGYGSIRANTTGNTYLDTFSAIPVGTADFRLEVRLRWNTKTSALANIGFQKLVGAVQYVGLTATSGQSNWHAITNNGVGDVDTGVACVSATYQTLVIQRTSGVVTFTINGTLVSTQTYATSFLDAKLRIFTSGTASSMYIDYVKCLVVR